jgi:hypothetical protein
VRPPTTAGRSGVLRPTGGTVDGWPGCTAPASYWHPYPHRGRGSRPRPVLHQSSGHGRRPRQGAAAGQLPAAARASVRRVDLDPHLPGVTRPAIRPPGLDPDVRVLLGGGGGPQRPAGCGGGRPCRLVYAAAVRLAGHSAAYRGITRLGARYPGRRVGRLAPVCGRERVHGVCG